MKKHKEQKTEPQSADQNQQHIVEEMDHAASDAKVAELTDLLKRTQADFENYKKRAEADKVQYVKYAGSLVLAKLLPLLDTIDSGIKNNTNNDVIKAIELIKSEIMGILKNEGIMPIDASRKEFDPFKHEALMIESTQDKSQDNRVIEEFQRGYMLHEKVLRHSKVKVAKYSEDSKENN